MSLVPVVPPAARSSAGSAGFNGWTPATPLRVQVDVTAVSGTAPTLDVFLEESWDGANWSVITQGQASAIAGVGQYIMAVTQTQGVTDLLRLRWVIAGTSPSFTFGVIVAGKP